MKTTPVCIFILLTGLFVSPADAANYNRLDLGWVRTYANCYEDMTWELFENLKRFDLLVIEPYYTPPEAVSEFRDLGRIVLGYISIGEADDERRYWPIESSLILAPNPDWPGAYYVDARRSEWRRIIVEEEIPYILSLGAYSGLMLDMLDVVDIYPETSSGIVQLVREIRERYPDLILIPNRGFGVLQEIKEYIDAFKYEEMSSEYDFEIRDYRYTDWGNDPDLDLLLDVLSVKEMPVLVLDHVRTRPPNEEAAIRCLARAKGIAFSTGFKFVWYGNSVDQDLPLWPFLSVYIQAALDKESYSPGEIIEARVTCGGAGYVVDPYLAVRTPDGGLFFISIDDGLRISGEARPVIGDWRIESLTDERILNYQIPQSAIEQGNYTLYGAFCIADTILPITDVSSFPFQISY